jgi:hypothetical protein
MNKQKKKRTGAAGNTSARERNKQCSERHGRRGSGHVVGKRKKRAMQSGTAGKTSGREINE